MVDVRNIVVGDIIELEAGDYVSADARIISSDSLEVNESTLTGESKSIKKIILILLKKKNYMKEKIWYLLDVML